VAQFAERARQTHGKNPRKKTTSELDYTPSRNVAGHGCPAQFALRRASPGGGSVGQAKVRLMNVAVPASFLAHPDRATQIRQNGLEVGNEGPYSLRF
jgi:hypothetical protein